MDAEDWLLDTERKLNTVGCNDEEKIRYGTHLLCGPAAACWENIVAVHPIGRVFTWAEFKRKFRDAQVPESIMELKRREFENLEQKENTIMKYVRDFSALSRYAGDEVNTDEKRKKRFLRGLHPYLRMQLRMLKAKEFQELVDAAITMEDDFKQVQEERRKRAKFEPKNFINTKPNTNLSFKPRFTSGGNRPQQGSGNNPNNVTCKNCGFRGHTTADCRRPKVVCFRCRKEGHMKRDCPNQGPGGGRPGGGAPNKNGNHGSSWKAKKPYGKLNCTSLGEVITSDKAVIDSVIQTDRDNPISRDNPITRQLAPRIFLRRNIIAARE
nr:uncharacterized protein LOC127303298 [Lolium perenne]